MKIGINGFGRIGRQVFRILWDRDPEVVHVNDITDVTTLAHLLAFDTSHGTWNHEVKGEGGTLYVDGQAVSVSAEKDPSRLPWKDKGAEVVLESTGVFRKREQARQHIEAGARKVLISAPGKDALDGNFVIGVNDGDYDKGEHDVISIGSCTTNCLAPVAKVLNEELGIERGLLNTIHAYTATQNILDGPHKDLRRARAAAENIIPTSTGAAKAIGLVMPELEGKMDGLAVRVPIKCGSILDLTCWVSRSTDADSVNDALRSWSEGRMKGILAVPEAPLVSSDIVGSTSSAVVSPRDTYVQDRLVKVLAWYDNEWGFSSRCADMMERML